MKQVFKNAIVTFVLGVLCCVSITAFALSIKSNQVLFTPSNENFKVENVEEALLAYFPYLTALSDTILLTFIT